MKIWKISRYAISLVYTVLLFICLLVCWLKGGKEKKEKSGCQRRGKDDCCKGWEGEEREESVWLARAEAWSSCRSMTFLFSSIWHSFVKQLILFCCRGIHWGFSMNRSTSRCPLVTWLQPGETTCTFSLKDLCYKQTRCWVAHIFSGITTDQSDARVC
jgi:hypothetical protein